MDVLSYVNFFLFIFICEKLTKYFFFKNRVTKTLILFFCKEHYLPSIEISKLEGVNFIEVLFLIKIYTRWDMYAFRYGTVSAGGTFLEGFRIVNKTFCPKNIKWSDHRLLSRGISVVYEVEQYRLLPCGIFTALANFVLYEWVLRKIWISLSKIFSLVLIERYIRSRLYY